MKNLILITAASMALMACEKETIVQGSSPEEVAADARTAANAAKVVLPPSITATKTYRCKDSSVVYIDWLSDNMSANFRATDNGAPVQLKTTEAGKPMIAEGYSLTGDAKAASITLARPDKGSTTCKA